MNVAILFHSHLRSFRKTNDSFKNNVLDTLVMSNHSYDIFIHTWDKEEFTTKTWHEGAKEIIDTNLSEVIEIYNPKLIEIETQNLKTLHSKY